jgi:hypothetical protein
MFLKPDDLLKYGGCFQAYSFMTRYYPDGAELSEIMRHKYVTPHFLHFGFDNFSASDEERALYYELLGIKCDKLETIYHCQNVSGSELCRDSENIHRSYKVSNSKEVNQSNWIVNSEVVDDSGHIVNSKFIFASCNVLNGTNLTNCDNVVGSTYVVDSYSIYNSTNITECRWLRECEEMEDSYFCANCSNSKHLLFCVDVENAEYMIFNKPVDAKRFETIKKQLFSIFKDWKTNLMSEWTTEELSWEVPSINRNYIKQYQKLPDTAWQWMKTLPGYNDFLMYQITFQPNLLDGEVK